MNQSIRQPIFYQRILQTNLKYSEQQQKTIQQQFIQAKIQKAMVNPFTTSYIPCYEETQLPAIILLMGKQVDELPMAYFNFTYFYNFVHVNSKHLCELFVKNHFICEVFCRTINRYLQMLLQSKQKRERLIPMKESHIVEFLLSIFVQQKNFQVSPKTEIKDNYSEQLFLSVIWYSSLAFMNQQPFKKLAKESNFEKLLKISILLVQLLQKSTKYEALRQFVSFNSYLLIFNGQDTLKPTRFYQFYLGLSQEFLNSEQNPIQIHPNLKKQFYNSLSIFLQKDSQYLSQLLRMVKHLIKLQIKSQILRSYFSVLIKAIRTQAYPDLKKQVYTILIEVTSNKMAQFVDIIFEDLLNCDPSLRTEQTQFLNRRLAQRGSKVRKSKFLQEYQKLQSKLDQPLVFQTINFIINTFFEEKLSLIQFAAFIEKQQAHFEEPSFIFLHQMLLKNNCQHAYKLFETFVEKKIQFRLKSSKQKENDHLVQQNWLEAANKNEEVYQIYLKKILSTVSFNTLNTNFSNQSQQLGSLRFQPIYLAKFVPTFKTILKKAVQHEILSEKVFIYMLYCQVVFGYQLDVSNYSYFDIFFHKVKGVQKISQVMHMIQHLIRQFMNPTSVLLYLQAILAFEQSEFQFRQKRIYDLSFLTKLIAQSVVFKISSYSIESITILIQLSTRIEDELFQKDCLTILKAWSFVMSPIQCNNLCYLFCYRQIKKIFPFMQEKQLKKNEDRILKLWKLIIELMDHEDQQEELLKFEDNKLDIIPSFKKDQKVSLEISGQVLRNRNMQMKWDTFIIYTSLKIYKIYLKNHKCFVYSNNKQESYKQVLQQFDVSQQVNSTQVFKIALKIHQVSENKYILVFSISGKPIQLKIAGNLEKIESCCSSSLFIRNLIIKTNSNELKNLKAHALSFANGQAKLKVIRYITIKKFINRVNFQLLFGLLGEMLKHFKQVDPSEAFGLLIKVSCRLFTFLIASGRPAQISREIQLIKTIFRLVLQGFTKTKYQLSISFQLQLKKSLNYSFYLYHLYISALLPHNLWKFFSQQTKQNIAGLLYKSLEEEGFKKLENQGIQFFEILGNLVPYSVQKVQILHKIIIEHELNEFLVLKFEHYLVKIGQIMTLKETIIDFVSGLIDSLQNDLPECVEKKKTTKFLLFSSKIFETILIYCTSQSKIKLIFYIFNNLIEYNYQNTKESLVDCIVNTMQTKSKGELIVLLVIQIQQDSLPRKKLSKLSSLYQKQLIERFNSKQQSNPLYLKLYFTIKIWNEIDPETLSDVIVTVQLFLSKRIGNPKEYKTIQEETENTICTSQYVEFLYNIKTNDQQNEAHKEHLNKIYQYSLKIIIQSPKQKLQKFMYHYLQFALNNLEFALLPFNIQRVKQFKIYNHIVILQYIYEIFIKMKYSGCNFNDQTAPAEYSAAVMAYIQYLVVNVEGTKEIKKPLLYVYPQISISKNLPRQKVVQLGKIAQNQEFRQVKGGLYYKLMLIVLELLENCIQVDFTRLIELLLIIIETERKSIFSFKPKSKQKLEEQVAIKRQILSKQIEILKDEHLKYYKQVQSARFLSKQKEISLSGYLIDFFVMRLCEYLKSYHEDLDEKLLQSYSSIVLKFFKNYKIQQFTPSISTQILKYENLLYILNSNLSSISSKQDNNSNSSTKRQSYIDEIIAKLNDIQQAFDPRLLCRLFRDINIPFCFGVREKQIRFMQFLDIHSILKRKQASEDPIIKISQVAKMQILLEQHYKSLKKYRKKAHFKQLDFTLRKIKKIYPYTSPNRTVIRIMDNCFQNMTCSITQSIACKDYSLKKLRHLESANLVYFQQNNEEEFTSIMERDLLKQLLDRIQSQSENLKGSLTQIRKGNQYCELVTREGVYFCQWHLTVKNLRLQPLPQRPDSQEIQYLRKGAHKMNLITKSLTTAYIQFQEIQEVFYRKSSQIYNSIQIFLKNGTSKFINLYRRRHVYAFIKILEKMIIGIKIIREPAKQFISKNFTQKWVEGQISNFDYIMLLNKYSGRTHNDLNQYYIFPWILSDYKSNKLDLSNPNAFRDLSKPIGAQNPQKLQRFKFLFKNNNRTHYYGSHYSTSLFVLYYLVRLQPFTTLHRDMQKGNFDLPDRLFSSMQDVWASLLNPSFISDIKQLIPEFYYLPIFLKNVGNIQFGQKMCGQEVSDVILPLWADNPEQLVLTMRAALQSDWVSKNLHLWIDLIFGVHQSSQKKYNIFLESSYEQKAQQMWKKGPVGEGFIHQIMYFGQCPSKLFTNQHRPKRMLQDLKLQKSITRRNSQFPYPESNFIEMKPELKVIKLSKINLRFKVEIEKLSKGTRSYQQTEVEIEATLDQLKQSLKYLTFKDKSKTENFAAANRQKIDLVNTELRIGKEPILALEMNYRFQHTAVNQMWIACYGLLGLRVYNWQQQLYWKWEKEEVCKVYIQATRMIFATPSGKLCFYNFFNRQLDEIQVIKQCSTMLMEAYCLPRLPTYKQNRNEIEYRVLCAFDHKKLTIVNYTFRQIFNYTSLKVSHP